MTDNESEQVQAAPQRRKITIIGVAVLALCVAVVLIFWLTGRGHELEIVVGSFEIGVRGTLYIAGQVCIQTP